MTTDEEFLKLAREHCAQEWSIDGYAPTVELEEDFLTLCREIERRALERAAEKCAGLAEFMEQGGGELEPGWRLRQAERLIRAMIKEEE